MKELTENRIQFDHLTGWPAIFGGLQGGKTISLMALQALVQLTFGNFLDLAQELMRNITDFVATAQFVFQMSQKTSRHFCIGQRPVIPASDG